MSRAPRPFLTRRTAPRIAGLEARIMFDAAAVAQAIDAHDGATDAAAVAPRPLVQAASPQAQALSPAAQAQWSAALEQANQQLLALAQGDGFAALLRESFGSGSQDAAAFERAVAQLTQAVLSGEFRLQVELRSGAELQGAMAAFAADAPGGGARIYVNADWLRTGAPAGLVQQTLVEEIGHAFDQRLNGAVDSRGDEGALFAALASGRTPDAVERAAMAADADRTTLVIDGRAVQVELAELSVPFSMGFIADQGTNPNQADNLQTFATLGIEYASFFQDSSTGLFTAQGNDIPGGVRLQFTDGTVVTVSGAINWRHTQGSTLYSFGFIPDPTAPTMTLPSGYVIDNLSNYGLELIGASYSYTDGQSFSGNAATSGLLDALNAYLATVRANDPNGPVTVNTLTTSDTTPTLTGTVTFNNGNETLEVQVNGVTYRDGDGRLSVTGNNWTLDITSAMSVGTYSVTATIVDLSTYYTLTDSTASELTITAPDTTAPVVTASQSFNYQENRTAGTVVATVAATDAVGVTGFRFSATGTNTSADGYYTIASNGQVTITAAGVAAGVANNDFETGANSFTLGVQAGDAAGNWSSAVNISLNVTNVNEAPVVNTSGGSATFVEGVNTTSTPVAVDPGLTLSDVDSATLSGATVAITGNYRSGEDVLAFTNDGSTMGNIVASFNAGTGVMTLTSAGGTATQAQWQAALRSVTYTDTAEEPNTATRTVQYQLSDGSLSSNLATRSVTVTAVNDAPAGTDKTVTTPEDTGYTFTAADFGFSDVDGDALTAVHITTVPGAGDGVLSLNGTAVQAGDVVSLADITSGLLVYTPALNAHGNGLASFTFQVQDNGGTANGGVDLDPSANTITVNVTAVNDAPAGTDKTVTTAEDTGYTFAASDFGFSDVDGNALLGVKITTLPASLDGALTLNGVAVQAGDVVSVADINAGRLVYTPGTNAHGHGQGSFTFQVQDDGGTAHGGVDLDPSANTITVNVTAVNDAPEVDDASDPDWDPTDGRYEVTTPEDTPKSGTIDMTDAEGDTLAFSTDTAPTHGSVTVDPATGAWTYTPDPDYVGTDSFIVLVDDGHGGTTTVTVQVTVTPVNDAPTAGDPSNPDWDATDGRYEVTTPEDTPKSGTLDTADLDGDTLAFSTDTAPTHGSVTVDPATGAWTYTPDPDYVGTDSFTVLVDDGHGGTTTVTVQVEVTPVNDPPTAGDPSNPDWDATDGRYEVTTPEDTPKSGTLDTADLDGDALAFSTDTAPTHGSVTVDPATGAWTYTPDPDYVGTDSFIVLVDDGHGGTTTVTVQVEVTPVNDAPTAGDPSNPDWDATDGRYEVSTPEDTPKSGTIDAGDVEGDALTFTVSTGPAHGTLTLDPATGAWTYTPDPQYHGPDRFTVLVGDGQGGTTRVEVRVDVTPVNDPPVAGDPANPDWRADEGLYAVETPQDTPREGVVDTADLDLDDPRFSVATGPAHGTVTIDPDTGRWTYVPAGGYSGADEFSITISDGQGGLTTVQVRVEVTPAPIVMPPAPRPVVEPVVMPAPAEPPAPPALVAPPVVFDSAIRAPLGGFAEPAPVLDSRGSLTLTPMLVISEPRPVEDIYTRASGFRIMVNPAPEPMLSSFRGVDEQVVPAGQSLNLQLPADTFMHTQLNETITLSARQADGRPLPAWLMFDAKAGTFKGTPPPGLTRDLAITVVARDTQGREAVTMFRIKVGRGEGAQRGAALSDQLHRGQAWAAQGGGWQLERGSVAARRG